jgi:hypothetical protein
LGRHFFADADFALADRGTALGAEIIENLFFRQD